MDHAGPSQPLDLLKELTSIPLRVSLLSQSSNLWTALPLMVIMDVVVDSWTTLSGMFVTKESLFNQDTLIKELTQNALTLMLTRHGLLKNAMMSEKLLRN